MSSPFLLITSALVKNFKLILQDNKLAFCQIFLGMFYLIIVDATTVILSV